MSGIDWDVVLVIAKATLKIAAWLVPCLVFGAFVERRIRRG